MPPQKQQRVLAGLLINRIKTLNVMTDVSVIGYLQSGEVIAREIAQALRCTCYLLSVVPIVGNYQGIANIYGAVSGINDAIKYHSPTFEQLQKEKNVFEDIQELKRQTMISALCTKECVSLLQHKDKLSKSTALLIDSTFISKTKFEVGIESLVSLNFKRVVPVAPFVNKETIIGASHPLRSGIYLKEFDNGHELHQFVESTKDIDEKGLRAQFKEY